MSRCHRLLLLAAVALDLLSGTSASPRSRAKAGGDDQRPAGRPRPRLPGLGRAAAGQAHAAAPGVPAGRAEALQRVPRPAAQPAVRATSRSRSDDAAKLDHRGLTRTTAAPRRCGSRARSCAASGSRRRTSPTRRCCRRCSRRAACRRGASTTRSRRPCTSATSRTRSAAIDSGVFGAPTYVAHGEMFWGQDRLDFLERRLARG